MAYRSALAIASLIVMVACGGDSNPAGPSGSPSGGGGGGVPNHGTVTAVVDGVAYSGTANAATLINGTLNVASNNAALTLAVSFATTGAAVGTVTTAGPTVLNVITTNGTTVTGSWSASVIGGSGTLTIGTLTASGATGTFAFTAVPPPAGGAGATGTKVVTSGTFNVTF